MMGFGSDSYSGYMGSGGSTNYDPPGGYQGSGYGLNSSIPEKKWGSTATNEYKPMGGSTFDKKTTTTTGVPIV